MLWVGIRHRLLTSTSQELNSGIWYVASVGGGGNKTISGHPPPQQQWHGHLSHILKMHDFFKKTGIDQTYESKVN